MGFSLKVTWPGGTVFLGKETISSIHVDVNTPMNSIARSNTSAATLWLSGKLTASAEAGVSSVLQDIAENDEEEEAEGIFGGKTADKTGSANSIINAITGLPGNSAGGIDSTLALFQWSLLPATSDEAYRHVEAQVEMTGGLFRTICLPNTFVIDYSERYHDVAGVGESTLILKQRADQPNQVTVS